MIKKYNLGFLITEEQILLGYKKRGFGDKKWNGFGGKVEENEPLLESMKREFREETGIEIIDPELVGINKFFYPNNEMLCYIYKTKYFKNHLIETDEMKSKWFDLKEIPFDEMWPDDRYWLPILLDGYKFEGLFKYNENNQMIYHYVEKVATLRSHNN